MDHPMVKNVSCGIHAIEVITKEWSQYANDRGPIDQEQSTNDQWLDFTLKCPSSVTASLPMHSTQVIERPPDSEKMKLVHVEIRLEVFGLVVLLDIRSALFHEVAVELIGLTVGTTVLQEMKDQYN
jgi:hypothetical protein